MGIIQREIDRIRAELVNGSGISRDELYAAQQALEWALEPGGIKSPFQMIMGIRGDSEDCSARPHPLPSSNICCRAD